MKHYCSTAEICHPFFPELETLLIHNDDKIGEYGVMGTLMDEMEFFRAIYKYVCNLACRPSHFKELISQPKKVCWQTFGTLRKELSGSHYVRWAQHNLQEIHHDFLKLRNEYPKIAVRTILRDLEDSFTEP